MRHPIFILLFSLVLGSTVVTTGYTQGKHSGNIFKTAEDSLLKLNETMLKEAFPENRMDAGISFGRCLYQTLQKENSYQYSFDALAKKIHVISSEDKKFRIFNWLLRPSNNMVRYYGIIQTPDGVYPLTNRSEDLEDDSGFLKKELPAQDWYGAEYYKLMVRTVNKKDYYFLFGLNTDGTYSNKKIIEVLSFNEEGVPVFGAPLFYYPNDQSQMQQQYRVFWQYKKGSPFYLDYDKEGKFIAFDHLVSEINNPLRKDTYVPSSRVDGIKWEKDKWIFTEAIIKPLILKDGQAPINGVIQKGID